MEFRATIDDAKDKQFIKDLKEEIKDYYGDNITDAQLGAVSNYLVNSYVFDRNLAYDSSFEYECNPTNIHDLALEFAEYKGYDTEKIEEDSYEGFLLSYIEDNKTETVEVEHNNETKEATRQIITKDLKEAMATATKQFNKSDINEDAYDPKVIASGIVWIGFATTPKPNNYRPLVEILDYFKFEDVDISSVNTFLMEFKEKCFFPKAKYVDLQGIYEHMDRILEETNASDIAIIKANERFHRLEGNIMSTVNSKALAGALCYVEDLQLEEVSIECNQITVERIYRRYIEE